MSEKPFDISSIGELMSSAQLICSNMNIGLIVYHMENLDEAKSLRFIFANQEASKYTGTDLSKLFGKRLHEAFPELDKTDVPEIFAEVARSKQAATIGVVEYSDENVKEGYYAVKAFPLPNDCIGVAFENVTHRKELEKMVKSNADQLRRKNEDLERLTSSIYDEVAVPLQKIHDISMDLKSSGQSTLNQESIKGLDEISSLSKTSSDLVEVLINAFKNKD